MQRTKPKGREVAALALLLLAGLCAMLFFTAQKQGYHVDELYTYELTNYPGGFYALEDGYLDAWHPGSFYRGVLSPPAGQRFDYRIPWNNQKIDVHPPLYYCLVFTACCLFPGLGAPWVGLLPNYLCLLAGAVFLYAAARRLTGRASAAWVVTAGWLLSPGVVGMAVFTRMYSLLMLAALALVYAHLVLWQRLQAAVPYGRAAWPVYAGLFAATLAGALTQYFYLVFCFFLCGLCALYLLSTRRFKVLATYCAAELGGLAAAYLAFPTMRTHIFSGPRGQQAFESFFDLGALAAWWHSLCRVTRLLTGQFGGFWVWAVLLGAAAVFLLYKGVRLKKSANARFVLGLFAAGLCYLVVIDKVAPFEADRYYALLYGPLALASGCLMAAAFARLPKLQKLLPLVLLPVLAAYLTVGVGYLYPEYGLRRAALADTAELPAIVLNNAGYEVAPDLFLAEFAERETVYQADGSDDAASLRAAADSHDLSGGFLVYGYIYEADTLRTLLQDTLAPAEITLLTEVGRCPVYYLVMG